MCAVHPIIECRLKTTAVAFDKGTFPLDGFLNRTIIHGQALVG